MPLPACKICSAIALMTLLINTEYLLILSDEVFESSLFAELKVKLYFVKTLPVKIGKNLSHANLGKLFKK